MAITTFLMYEPIRRLNNHLPQSIKIIGCLWANLIMDTLGDEWLSLSLHLYLALSLSPSPFLSISSLPLSPSLHFLHHPSPSSSTCLSFLASLLVSLPHNTGHYSFPSQVEIRKMKLLPLWMLSPAISD